MFTNITTTTKPFTFLSHLGGKDIVTPSIEYSIAEKTNFQK